MGTEPRRKGSGEAEAVVSKAMETFETEYQIQMEKSVAAFWNYSISIGKYPSG